MVGMPGPFLGFGSGSRFQDIAISSFVISVSVFLFSLFGLVALKIMAAIDRLNLKLKMR